MKVQAGALWKLKKPYLSNWMSCYRCPLALPLHICHVDSTALTVLFITFMAQPGSRRTGLFNCRLWRWLKCGDGDDDDNSNSDAHGVVHWPDHQENCNRYMGNWWIWKLLCKGQTAFNSITIKRLLVVDDDGNCIQLSHLSYLLYGHRVSTSSRHTRHGDDTRQRKRRKFRKIISAVYDQRIITIISIDE